jgi:asparagine synthase (glutamine-hydrolysing)
MCGLAGLVDRAGAPMTDAATLAGILGQALAHRGPDGAGTWQSRDGDVLLVHRRLAIIDPGPAGAQPMATPDGRMQIVFNGEIYNFRELRADLESRGERFATSCDTEVLLRLIARGGPRELARVRGMFALACWNTESRSLLLARDRFGMKPLYVAETAQSIAFASELKALRAARLVDVEPSPAAVLAFLAWGSVPAPLAWNRGAESLEPGTWIEWRRGGPPRRGRFADLRQPYCTPEGNAPVARISTLRAIVGGAVRDSVRAHLSADVPVGVFLSGGIDSGAIVSAAASAGAAHLQTFTVGFDDASSETARARRVAAQFGTRHHELHVDAASIVDGLPAVFAHLDQPTNDAVNTFFVAKAVAATGIKVVLSGTGGDELFGGYPSFSRLPRALGVKRMAGPLWPAARSIAGAFVPARLEARWRHFAHSNGHLGEAYRVQRGFLLPSEIGALAGPALKDQRVWPEAAGALELAERARLDALGPERLPASVARLESSLYLQSQLLRDIDVMSMAHGLEVRVPFVDHDLIASVWPELARHRSLLAGKPLLHASLERPLPSEVVSQPKQGFTLPFASWMRGALGPVVQEGLRRAAACGWITTQAPQEIWRAWQSGETHWSRPWGLSVLGHFAAGGPR